jgi:hypothetical protein
MMTKTPKDWIRSLFANSSSKKEAERRLAQIGLSMVQGLQSGEISLRQSQEDLFNLKSYLALRNQHSNRPLLELMEWGMELEDVAKLAPHGLQESYDRMIALAKQVVRQSLPRSTSTNHRSNGKRSSRVRGAGRGMDQRKRRRARAVST